MKIADDLLIRLKTDPPSLQELLATPLYCHVCRKELPADRVKKGAITCRPAESDCAKLLKQARRARRDARACRHCAKPSTPEQRADFKRWQRERGMLGKKGRPSKGAKHGDAS